MPKSLVAFALLVSAAAPAQVITSYQSNKPSSIKGDPDKIVCQKEETIGTRLGAKKVCMTVSEWNARQKDERERTERIQGGTCQAGEGQGCLDPH